MKYDLDIIRHGLSSRKVEHLISRGSRFRQCHVEYLQEFSIFVRTPGFRFSDVMRFMPGLSDKLYYHAKGMRFDGDVDLVLDNAKSITRSDARKLTLRAIQGGAGLKGTLPSWCLQELIQSRKEGVSQKMLAEELGVAVERVRFWTRRVKKGKRLT